MPTASAQGGNGSSSTAQEKITYQWFTSRLMVTGFDLTHQGTVQPDLEITNLGERSAARIGFALAHACQPGQSPIADR